MMMPNQKDYHVADKTKAVKMKRKERSSVRKDKEKEQIEITEEAREKMGKKRYEKTEDSVRVRRLHEDLLQDIEKSRDPISFSSSFF